MASETAMNVDLEQGNAEDDFFSSEDDLCSPSNSTNPGGLNGTVEIHSDINDEVPSRKLANLVKATQLAKPMYFTASLEEQPKAANGVPIVIESCLRYFANALDCEDCEGLFRKSGEESKVRQMWDYMENQPFARLSTDNISTFMSEHPTFSPHEVSSFLKRFVRSLDGIEPVLTNLCYKPLFDLMKQECPEDIIAEKCKRIIGQLLVPVHRTLLGRLCRFLLNFSQLVEDTRMDIPAIVVCFGFVIRPPPNIEKQCSTSEMNPKQLTDHILAQKNMIKFNSLLIEILIKHSHHVFT